MPCSSVDTIKRSMRKSKANYNGVFIPQDGVGAGHFQIAGKNTSLKLLNSNPMAYLSKENRDHHGILNDGSKASLLECVHMGNRRYGLGESAQFETRLFPHYVLIGNSFINSNETAIQAVHYHFENVGCLVNPSRTFDIIHPEQEEIRKLLEADHLRQEKTAREHNWEPQKFEPEIGDHPVLLYFSGVYEIAKCHARVGMVTIAYSVSHGVNHATGVSIDHEIMVSLEFASPTNVSAAFASLGTLHSFFELCLGRRQRYLWIEVELVNGAAGADYPNEQRLQGYWSYGNERITRDPAPTSYVDILLVTRQAEFATVLSGWLNSAPDVGDARGRFANSFYSDVYGADRFVGSANMFDLLPQSHVLSKVEVDKTTKDAVKESQRLFKALPECFARQSVLSALGRVGTASLRDKICHRASIITNLDPKRFAELDLPCKQAVLCRNYFVHGSDGAFDYNEEVDAVVFLADTLEFVFAVSDLIELGWDYNSWLEKGSSLSHKFGSYVVNYEANIQRLKQLIKA